MRDTTCKSTATPIASFRRKIHVKICFISVAFVIYRVTPATSFHVLNNLYSQDLFVQQTSLQSLKFGVVYVTCEGKHLQYNDLCYGDKQTKIFNSFIFISLNSLCKNIQSKRMSVRKFVVTFNRCKQAFMCRYPYVNIL